MNILQKITIHYHIIDNIIVLNAIFLLRNSMQKKNRENLKWNMEREKDKNRDRDRERQKDRSREKRRESARESQKTQNRGISMCIRYYSG